jgi:proline iminopeptidase
VDHDGSPILVDHIDEDTGWQRLQTASDINRYATLRFMIKLLSLLLLSIITVSSQAATFKTDEGYVDANGLLIYYTSFGQGPPLLILHGGPGASHDYFLPYLLPLARHNRLIFIDERGSGRSQKLDDPAGYTVENMVEDVEGCAKN